MQRKIFVLLLMLSGLSVLSCGGVVLKDDPFCVELDPSRAHCVLISSGKTFDIDETHPYSFTGKKEDLHTWWELRPQMLSMPIQTYADIKIFIAELCKKTGQCANANFSKWQRASAVIDQTLSTKASVRTKASASPRPNLN